MKNISEGKIRYPFSKCKNKKFHYKDIVMMFIEKYLNLFMHGEPYETMLEKMIGSTFSSNNIYAQVSGEGPK
jgi:hypothetical protein